MSNSTVVISSPVPVGQSSSAVSVASLPPSSSIVDSPSSAPPPTPSSSSVVAGPQTSSLAPLTLISTIVPSASDSSAATVVVIVTSTTPHTTGPSTSQTVASSPPSSTSATSSAASSAASTLPVSESDQGTASGMTGPAKTAVAVVVPVVAVALFVLLGLLIWRRRKQKKDAEELRKKEMEEYIYNPNHDQSMGGAALSPNGEDLGSAKETDQGYRGWGATATSTARKTSTNMSSNPIGVARSNSGGNDYSNNPHSPTGTTARTSDGHSSEPLVDGTPSEKVGALGAGPVAGKQSGGGINRGPSNASSAYSGANRSDVSADGPPAGHMGSPQYYGEAVYQGDGGGAQGGPYADGGAQPVIRDVQARRNTRIENPTVFPQQGNAGISQNF